MQKACLDFFVFAIVITFIVQKANVSTAKWNKLFSWIYQMFSKQNQQHIFFYIYYCYVLYFGGQRMLYYLLIFHFVFVIMCTHIMSCFFAWVFCVWIHSDVQACGPIFLWCDICVWIFFVRFAKTNHGKNTIWKPIMLNFDTLTIYKSICYVIYSQYF